MRMSLILLVFTLFIGFSSATVSLISPDRPTYDPTVAVTNFNQFKTNLDRAQEWLISIYKGAYGGISALWFYYSWWLIASMFYYTFGVTYLNAKDDAEAELKAAEKENEIHQQRAFQIGNIDVSSIFNKLRSIDQRMGGKLGDSCYQRGLCEMRTYFATTQFYNLIPRFLRKMFKLEPHSRELGTCGEIHRQCSVTSLLASLI